jgi:Phage tail tube protein
LGTPTPTATQIATTTVYRQIHTIGEMNRSLTVQVGKPQTNGTVQPFTYTGVKFPSWELSCAIDQYLNLKLEADARNQVTTETLVSPTYTATNEEMFHFGQIDVEIGGTVALASGIYAVTGGTDVTACKGFSVKHDASMATERYFAGATQLKAAPIENGMREVSGSLDCEFADKAQLYDRMASEETVPIKIRFTATTIVGTGYPAFEILMPACKLDDGTPTVDGPDVLGNEVNFKVYDDGTNPPIQILYESPDATVL